MNTTHFKISREDVGIGLSKIGGLPDLITGIEYPVNENGFYEFVAQINFGELDIDSELLPKTGILSLFVGSISQSEYNFFYFPEVPNDLNKTEIPTNIQFLGDTDFRQTKSGKIRKSKDEYIHDSVFMISETVSYKDPIFLKLIGYGELETNIMFDYQNNHQVKYFGRISGDCEIEQLLKSEEECFQLGDLSWEDWKEKVIKFDKQKHYFEEKYNELICLISIPTNYEIGMIWGDMLRVEFFIMKEDLLSKRFDKMIVKYAPD